jgi:hypothetical protein
MPKIGADPGKTEIKAVNIEVKARTEEPSSPELKQYMKQVRADGVACLFLMLLLLYAFVGFFTGKAAGEKGDRETWSTFDAICSIIFAIISVLWGVLLVKGVAEFISSIVKV